MCGEPGLFKVMFSILVRETEQVYEKKMQPVLLSFIKRYKFFHFCYKMNTFFFFYNSWICIKITQTFYVALEKVPVFEVFKNSFISQKGLKWTVE